MNLERLMLSLTRVELQVEQWWAADNEPPSDYTGPDLVAVLFAGRLVSAGRGQRRVLDLDPQRCAAVADAATRALREPQTSGGFDTAWGRTTTLLFLRVQHPLGPDHSGSAELTVNHLAPVCLPPAWSELLRHLRDPLGPLGPAESEGWDRALTWAAPQQLPREWGLGGVVRLPHRVNTLEHAGPLYLRIGQEQGRRGLYRLEGDALRREEDGAVVPRVDDTWILPCGGGRVQVHPRWQRPPLVVLWADDDRGLFVQRG